MFLKRRGLIALVLLVIFLLPSTFSAAYFRGVRVHIPRIMLKSTFYNPAVIHFKITVYDSGRYIRDVSTKQWRVKKGAYLFGPQIEVKMPHDWTPVNMSVKIEVVERGHLYNSVHSSVQRNLIKGASVKDVLDTGKIYMEYKINAHW